MFTDCIEGVRSRDALATRYDGTLVDDVLARVTRSEFERRQTPLPLGLTRKAPGRDRNYPIAATDDHGDRDGGTE